MPHLSQTFKSYQRVKISTYSKTSLHCDQRGKGNFGGITSLAIDRGLDFCQLHVDIGRHACTIGEKNAFSQDLTIPHLDL